MTPIVRVVLDIRTDLDPAQGGHLIDGRLSDSAHLNAFSGSAVRQGSPDGETPQAEKELAGKRLEAGEPQTGAGTVG